MEYRRLQMNGTRYTVQYLMHGLQWISIRMTFWTRTKKKSATTTHMITSSGINTYTRLYVIEIGMNAFARKLSRRYLTNGFVCVCVCLWDKCWPCRVCAVVGIKWAICEGTDHLMKQYGHCFCSCDGTHWAMRSTQTSKQTKYKPLPMPMLHSTTWRKIERTEKKPKQTNDTHTYARTTKSAIICPKIIYYTDSRITLDHVQTCLFNSTPPKWHSTRLPNRFAAYVLDALRSASVWCDFDIQHWLKLQSGHLLRWIVQSQWNLTALTSIKKFRRLDRLTLKPSKHLKRDNINWSW